MLKALAEAGGKVIGGARFSLTSVLPGVLMVTIIAAVQRAGLYSLGAQPDIAAIQPDRNDTAAVVLFVFFAFVVGVLLRPFEAAIVQLLEGYWERPSPLAVFRGAAVERHRRRRERALIVLRHALEAAEKERATPPPGSPLSYGSLTLREFAERDRHNARRHRRVERARTIRNGYPTEIRPDAEKKGRDPHGELMPTSLGNMLLRAERLSGDRYGLEMMRVYPRIYPFVAPRMEAAVTQQLSLIAATASLAVSLGITTLGILPLVLRWDVWSLLPLAPAVLSVLAYRGAITAAAFHGTLLSAVFDVHQFDLIKVFHYETPESTDEMIALNKRISDFLGEDTVGRLKALGGLDMDHPPESDDVLHRANGNGSAQA